MAEVFADHFESGDASGWDGSQTDGSATLTFVASNPYPPLLTQSKTAATRQAYVAKCDVPSGSTYAKVYNTTNTFADGDSRWFRFKTMLICEPDETTPHVTISSDAWGANIFSLDESGGEGTVHTFGLGYDATYTTMYRFATDTTTGGTDVHWTSDQDERNYQNQWIEWTIKIKFGDTDGEVAIWRDGTLEYQTTGIRTMEDTAETHNVSCLGMTQASANDYANIYAVDGLYIWDNENDVTFPGGTVVFENNNPEDSSAGGYTQQITTGGSITAVTDPLGSGDTVFKMSAPNDNAIPPRAQLVLNYQSGMASPDSNIPRGLEWFYRWKWYIPSALPSGENSAGSNWLALATVAFGPPWSGSGFGSWGANVRLDETAGDEDRLVVQQPVSPSRVYVYQIDGSSSPVQMDIRGQWNEVVVHYRLDPDVGFVRFWWNGTQYDLTDYSATAPSDTLEFSPDGLSLFGSELIPSTMSTGPWTPRVNLYHASGAFEQTVDPVEIYHYPPVIGTTYDAVTGATPPASGAVPHLWYKTGGIWTKVQL